MANRRNRKRYRSNKPKLVAPLHSKSTRGIPLEKLREQPSELNSLELVRLKFYFSTMELKEMTPKDLEDFNLFADFQLKSCDSYGVPFCAAPSR